MTFSLLKGQTTACTCYSYKTQENRQTKKGEESERVGDNLFTYILHIGLAP